MKESIRSNITIKASGIHDNTNTYDCVSIHDNNTDTYDCASTHERTTTPPRIFRPLFQTKDSPSLGRRSSELMNKFISRSMSRPISITVIVSLAILFNAIIGTISGISNNNTFATSSLNVTIANTISLDIMPKSTSGTFAHSSTSDNTVSVSTNNYTGYTLGIAASTANDNALSYKENNTIVDSINSHNVLAGVSEANYANDSYASSNNLNNTWGYRPSKYNSEDNTTTNLYYPAPTGTSNTILDTTSVANPTTSNNYNIAIGARVGLDKTPGAYTNTFVITVVANPTPYTITYNANAGSDTVSNMPSNVTNGLSYADTISLDNPASPTIPTRTGYDFAGWCVSGASETSCDSTLYSTTNNNLANFPINNTASSNNINVYAIWTPTTRTCTKRYRLQNANGTFPNTYTNDGTEELNIGQTCTYTKSITDYKNTASGTNNAPATTSGTVTGDGLTLSLDFYRNTYTLTVSKGSNISAASAITAAVHGSNYYRWGQGVALSATKSSNTTCATYGTPSWTQSGTAGTFSATSSATPTFTMGMGNATVTATSSASNIAQVITLSKGTGVSGINIGGTNRTGTSVSLTCGSYTIRGNYNSGYAFSSWSKSGSISLSSTSAASTTMTVSGSGTLTLNAKTCTTTPLPSGTGIMQTWSKPSNLTSYCDGVSTTLTDNRSGNKSYTVAKIGDLVWMTKNLDLPGGTTLTSSDSNVSSNYTLPASSTSGFANPSTAYVYNSGRTTCSSPGCYSYYSWVAATAGNNPSSGSVSSDICPKGWRLPTQAELNTLKDTYTTGATLTASPFLGVYAGRYDNGSLRDDAGSYGYYWSSTASSASRAYALYFYSGYTGDRSDYKALGYSVRCVAK